MKTITRIFNKDSSLWSNDKAVQKLIDNRLGWLDAVKFCRDKQLQIEQFSQQVNQAGFKHVLLLGMGGSGLAPEVFAKFFPENNGLNLLVLDSTCTEQIIEFEQKLDLDKTLFIVSSKSGGTIETLSLCEYFYTKITAQKGMDAGQQFIAITDVGSGLQHLAKERQFLECFINPSDIGGRFSALSYFGLIPAVLLGISLDKLLSRAEQAVQDCHSHDGVGVKLGEWLVQGYQTQQLDKLVLHVPQSLSPFIWWVEQLVAESLGKQGQGILPVLSIDNDHKLLPNSKNLHINIGDTREDFSNVNHATWGLIDEYDIAAHFFHWEFAVALAGISLGINPFDEPNVTEAKVRTKQLLQTFVEDDSKTEISIPDPLPLSEFLSQVKPDSYISILAYWAINKENDKLLQVFKKKIEQASNVPVTVNYGPRYLHSTGQLHKGGKRQGLSIVLTQTNRRDINIPKQAFSFNTLCRAQALGDFQILSEKGLPAVFYHLTDLNELFLL